MQDIKNEQFICISSGDESIYKNIELPISVVFVSVVKEVFEFSLNGELIDLEYVYINFIGFVSLSQSGLKIAKRLDDMWKKNFGKVMPQGLDLSKEMPSSTNNSITHDIMFWLATKLLSDREIIVMNNVQLRRDLAFIRNEYEEIQSSFQRLELFSYDAIKQSRWSAFILEPISNHALYALNHGDVLIQRIPCDSIGLCDLAINIANQKIRTQGILNISLECIEDESVVASWSLLSTDLINGWIRLSLTQSLGVDARTPQLRLEWNGNEPLQLGKSVKHPDDRFCATLNKKSTSAVLALKGWKYIAGTNSPLPSDSYVSKGSTTKGWIVSQEQLAKAIESNNSNFQIIFIEENSALMVHPLPSGICFAKIKCCFKAGARQICTTIKTIANEGPIIEYSIALANSKDFDAHSVEMSMFQEGFHSEWIRIEAMCQSQIHLFLPCALDEDADLYLMTRMPIGTNDCSNAWATFSDIYATA
jgi:hypothetical protein